MTCELYRWICVSGLCRLTRIKRAATRSWRPDSVATTIVDVDYQTIKAYPGNYARFVRSKRDERERREAEIVKREGLIVMKVRDLDEKEKAAARDK